MTAGLRAILTAGLTGALLTVLAGSPALAEGDAARGSQLAETCLGCHGIPNYKNTYPSYRVPKLGGQNTQYIVDALNAYGTGQRPHGTMHAQASTMSDQDMQDIAAFLSGQGGEKPTGVSGTPPEKATVCEACHGKNGIGTAPNYPNLAGQYVDYLSHSLAAYQSGERQNAIMAGFAAQLTKEDIKQLAAWYARQEYLLVAQH